jgi:hypothetical protein
MTLQEPEKKRDLHEGAITIRCIPEKGTPSNSTQASRIEEPSRLVYVFVLPNTPPQTVTSLRVVAKCFTFAEGRAFMRVSATILLVGQ